MAISPLKDLTNLPAAYQMMGSSALRASPITTLSKVGQVAQMIGENEADQPAGSSGGGLASSQKTANLSLNTQTTSSVASGAASTFPERVPSAFATRLRTLYKTMKVAKQITTPTKQPLSPIIKWKMSQSPGGTINPYPSNLSVKKALRTASQSTGVCYAIIKEETVVNEEGQQETRERIYIGSNQYTDHGNNLMKRLSKYKHEINKPGKIWRRHIVHAIRRSPKKFSVSIIDIRPEITEQKLLALEETYQDLYDSRNRIHGYNHSRPTLERLRCKGNRRPIVGSKRKRTIPARKTAEAASKKIRRQLFSDT